MKTKISKHFLILIVAVLQSCVSNQSKYTGIAPLSPKGQNAREVARIGAVNPTFTWESTGTGSSQYDFIIWKLIPSPSTASNLKYFRFSQSDSFMKALNNINITEIESPQSFPGMYVNSIHKLVLQKNNIKKPQYTLPVRLDPDMFYLWSIRNSGSEEWSQVILARTDYMTYVPNSSSGIRSSNSGAVPFLVWTSN